LEWRPDPDASILLIMIPRHAHQAVRSTGAGPPLVSTACYCRSQRSGESLGSLATGKGRPLPPRHASSSAHRPPAFGPFLFAGGAKWNRGHLNTGAQPPGNGNKGEMLRRVSRGAGEAGAQREEGERDGVCVYLTTKRKEVTITDLELMKHLLIARRLQALKARPPT